MMEQSGAGGIAPRKLPNGLCMDLLHPENHKPGPSPQSGPSTLHPAERNPVDRMHGCDCIPLAIGKRSLRGGMRTALRRFCRRAPEPKVLTILELEDADSVPHKTLDGRARKKMPGPPRFASVLDAAETALPKRWATLPALRNGRSAWSIAPGAGACSGSGSYDLRWRVLARTVANFPVEAPPKIWWNTRNTSTMWSLGFLPGNR